MITWKNTICNHRKYFYHSTKAFKTERLFFYPKTRKDVILRRNHHRRSVPLRLSNQNPKLTIKRNIQKGQVHLYGIKIRYPQRGKDIRQLGVRRRRQNRTEKNQRTHDGILPQLQSVFGRTESG